MSIKLSESNVNNDLDDIKFSISQDLFNNFVDTLLLQQLLERNDISNETRSLLEEFFVKIRDQFVLKFSLDNRSQIEELKKILFTINK